MTTVPTDLLVAGQPVETADRFEVVDPATLEVIAEVADAGPRDAAAAVETAGSAFASWAATSPRQRSLILSEAHRLMLDEAEHGARLIVRENGKAWSDAYGEIVYAAEFFRWFAEETVRVRGDFRSAPAGDKTIIVDHRPVGIAYLVTPWNFPAAMATRKLAPALAAGCPCVLKPAAETPLTALWIGDVLRRAGVPDGVVSVLPTTDPARLTTAILADPRVTALSFTGSTGVGTALLAAAAPRVLRTSMELGGNAPFLVLEGTDVEEAVEVAMVAKMRNGGSACTAANRFYVHASLAGPFARAFTEALGRLRIGPGLDTSHDVGAMVSAAERDKVRELVERGAAEGGSVTVAGSAPESGTFLAPHVVTGVEHGGTLTRTEIFGPVAPIVSFEDLDDAVAMANDVPVGLLSYVLAGDPGTGLRVARRLESGMVAVNRGVVSDPAAPFGGVKESGLGREGGFEGIHEFLESRYIAADL
ncbi:NAD-dependent succinate-semialdehyde dehydrogenase [Aeromicrobium sp. YIM 150415]|uniref:NAD-dependent succinate-semialdehyde dehydrogenase n=1 Tax=Aeromicrobium sp. YIM 150415 TaxID=2803912 RepID=UPI00196475F1|nr:NAD-dependent succinate-semialdehyde dehydrogenase [Aeromicrobium sp. YIM 150415]MBM9463478.1 NAD-dependent succinate-semialdehyde dehydrogenase [Aeromicrobium sp. YIM 150415]